jgi:STE24 endopeptidase
MNSLLLAIASAYLLISLLRGLVDFANLRYALKAGVPEEFAGLVDGEKFQKSQAYLAASTRFSLWHRLVTTAAALGFLQLGGFGAIDRIALSFGYGPIPTALLYFLGLGALDQLLELPFSWAHTFVLEQKFGFNRSTYATFFGDLLKGWALGILLGGLLLGGVLAFFLYGGANAWLWAWLAFTAFQLLVTFLAPVLLLPLFNRFEPLPAGELRSAIEAYAAKVDFRLQGIFTMDGSKRSSRANAFFTGFGRFRRIVLFDTLIQQHSVPELVAVLAHEVGHFKKKHILKMMAIAIASSLLMFWLLSLILQSEALSRALGFPTLNLEAAFTAASWLYAPFSLLASFLTSAVSRSHEFEADAYAAASTGAAGELSAALKRLSIENLSNLNPHPWKVRLDYSHPPVVQRVRALAALGRG